MYISITLITMPPVSSVNESILKLSLCQTLNLLYCFRKSMAIIRIAMKALNTYYEARPRR